MTLRVLSAFLLLAALGCGVKGKPLPPLKPLSLGDGKNLKGQEKEDPSPRRGRFYRDEADEAEREETP